LNFRKHTFVYFKDMICLYGNMIAHPTHRHYLIQIFIHKNCFSNKVTCTIFGSNIPHGIMNPKGIYFSLLINPESWKGEILKEKYLKHSPKGIYTVKEKLLPCFFENLEDSVDCNKIESIANSVLKELGLEHPSSHKKDERIKAALAFIKAQSDFNIPIDKICSHIGLSESHFYALFKSEVGLSYRQYLLWQKLSKAIVLIFRGSNYTQAAYNAGFSDSAHLSHTFKEVTGASLSQIFKNQRLIQFFSGTPF
jgi:AraC-like DNA-binding protein